MSVLDSFKLDGRVALVTGASRGIGCAIARGLSEAGATVYGIGRSGETEAQEGVFQYRQCDIQDKESFSRLLAELVETHGRLDILVNAAGITMPDQMEADPLATFQRTLELNLTAAFACSYLALPYMLSGGYGSIINVTSIGAALGFPGNPGYVASKGGLAAMTRALARDYGARGIRVNNIVPGYVHTAMTHGSYSNPELHAARAERTMLGRWGSVGELSGAAVFLASPASSYMTGADLVVDGGWSAKGL
ncbi:SDR family oxidoreductase [Pseudomonas wenzhouensis]|uniref:SDR family oxidoreductase n=1 Tax=Pseudomonas wenzhouensis TaxID=2906062 RepID=UPI001E31BBCC|nr:SDR family oxidoreductase [Pseudomonas wenzhouensis]UFQ99215.1 SDR family oxidoreductase [Pseudomonas wenzhouensis]